MSEVMKWAFVGDLQIPYHDKRAVALFLKVMKWWKPDAVDFVGDIDDQLEYSTFSDGTTDEFFNRLSKNEKANEKALVDWDKAMKKYHEVGDMDAPLPVLSSPVDINPLPFIKENAVEAGKFYADVRKILPNADMHSSLGNHDIRVFNYVDKKAPAYLDQVTPEMLWGLDNLGITWRMYKQRPFMRFAGIHVHHGVGSTTTGLAVKNDIENMNISLVRGHDHRGGVVYKSYPMPGTSLVGMGTGHLCDADAYGLQYAENPTWQQGFGIAYVVDGKAHLQFIPMRGYTVVLDGKVFRG